MTIEAFLSTFGLRPDDINIHDLVEQFRSEMDKGNRGEESSLRMLPTYIEADNAFLKNKTVLAMDAGGTNFRGALMHMDDTGVLKTDEIIYGRMPGLDGELSKAAFFQAFADLVKPMAEKAQAIGFCFSYPTEMFPNKDGRLLQFSKEVEAPEVIGHFVGENLLASLGMPGKPIVLLNDTVATLLAGKSACAEKSYDSYIGFILGTGTNTCYIEQNSHITKEQTLNQGKSQIINIESGNFGKVSRSQLDIAFDNTTHNPGAYVFEKMLSGAYLGNLCLFVLKTAADQNVFSAEAAQRIADVGELTTEQANRFLDASDVPNGLLNNVFTEPEDRDYCCAIIENLIARAAVLAAANIAAVVLKTGKGENPQSPILVTVEGTTFYKLKGLKDKFEDCLNHYLSGERKRYVEFTNIPQSSIVGAGLAALIE